MARVFTDIFGVHKDGFDVQRCAVNACRGDYAVIPVKSGGKAPLCTLNTKQLRERGRDHPCGVNEYIRDPVEADKVFGRLIRNGEEVNLGVVAGPSRLVVVDADTATEVAAFQSDWAAADGEWYRTYNPTVWTPGARNDDGTWRHRGGGHYYFALPEGVDLSWDRVGAMKLNGYDVRWGMSQTLVPPSRRPEGAYQASGTDVVECPAWLLEKINAHIDRVVERRLERAAMTANDSVAQWSIETPWATLLERHGWTATGKTDKCSCEIFTRPGGGSTSYKSATAHEADCVLYDNVEGHGPLHTWSTEIDGPLRPHIEAGQQTFTKLTFVSIVEYAGDTTAAMTALGIIPDFTDWNLSAAEPVGVGRASVDEEPESPAPSQTAWDLWIQDANWKADALGIPTKDDQGRVNKHRQWFIDRIMTERTKNYDGGPGVEEEKNTLWRPVDNLLEILDTLDVAEESIGVLRRTDGALMFAPSEFHLLFGQSECGKSFLACLMMKQQIAEGKRVLYIDFEDVEKTFLIRMRDIGVDLRPAIEAGLLNYMSPASPPTMDVLEELVTYDLIVIDSLAEVVAGIKDGSLKDGSLIRRLFRLFRKAAQGGPAVVLIAHATEKSDVPLTTLGASEQRQAVTGQEVLVQNVVPLSKKGGGQSLIYVTKDRKSLSADDVEVDAQAPKSMRRLWGELRLEPTINEGEWRGTQIDVHAPKAQRGKENALDKAEREVLAYLSKDEVGGVATVAEIVAAVPSAKSTVYAAIDKLIKDRWLHSPGSETSEAGGRPTKIIKHGPAPDPPKTK